MLYELYMIIIITCEVFVTIMRWKLGTQISLAKAPETAHRTWTCSSLVLRTVHLTVLKLWQIIYSVVQYDTCNNYNSFRDRQTPSLSYSSQLLLTVTSLCSNRVTKDCEDAWDVKAIYTLPAAFENIRVFVCSSWCYVENPVVCFD